jgi:parvulin-like peptidyl-prolyl isomerase
MPKKKKTFQPKKPSDKLPMTEDAKRRKRRTNAIVIASAILAFIIGVGVFGYWFIYQKPLQATIIEVNGKKISVKYILNRCLLGMQTASDPSTVSPLSVIQSVIQEQLIEQVAVKAPYNINVTEADIDKELRNEANGNTSTTTTTTTTPLAPVTTTTTTSGMSDAEFHEWYLQRLNESQLPEDQFRDLIRVSIISQRLNQYLINQMSNTIEQVHLWDIVLPDTTTATDVKSRIDAGEDFSTIARELSQDSDTQAKGGDMGWIPLKALDSTLETVASKLEIGEVSYPVQTTAAQQQAQSSQQDQSCYLLMVTEKDPARVIDQQYIPYLQGRLLQDWLNDEMSKQQVKLLGRGQKGGYDSSTEAWLKYEIEKLKASRGIIETTTTTTTNPLTGQ